MKPLVLSVLPFCLVSMSCGQSDEPDLVELLVIDFDAETCGDATERGMSQKPEPDGRRVKRMYVVDNDCLDSLEKEMLAIGFTETSADVFTRRREREETMIIKRSQDGSGAEIEWQEVFS